MHLDYLDDAMTSSKTAVEHLDEIRSVLQLFSEAGVTLKLEKCHFFTNTVDCLGLFIRPGKLKVE